MYVFKNNIIFSIDIKMLVHIGSLGCLMCSVRGSVPKWWNCITNTVISRLKGEDQAEGSTLSCSFCGWLCSYTFKFRSSCVKIMYGPIDLKRKRPNWQDNFHHLSPRPPFALYLHARKRLNHNFSTCFYYLSRFFRRWLALPGDI